MERNIRIECQRCQDIYCVSKKAHYLRNINEEFNKIARAERQGGLPPNMLERWLNRLITSESLVVTHCNKVDGELKLPNLEKRIVRLSYS